MGFLPFIGNGGGGGLASTDAVLIVRAPAGSTVTAAKGGTTLTGDQRILSGRPYVSDYVIPVPQSLFDENAWTITATKGSDSWTGSVTISASMVYLLDAVVHVPLSLYQEVEYLQTSGSQYIAMTSDILASGYVSEIRYKAVTFAKQNPVLQHGTTNANAREGNLATSTSGYTSWFNHSDQLLISKSDTGIVTGQISNTGSGITVNLETADNSATYSWSYTPNLTGGSFICRNGRSTYQYGKYYVYYYAMKNGSTPVRQMFPCYRLTDNVAGMYDKITDTFFTNAGSGTFTVGPDC